MSKMMLINCSWIEGRLNKLLGQSFMKSDKLYDLENSEKESDFDKIDVLEKEIAGIIASIAELVLLKEQLQSPIGIVIEAFTAGENSTLRGIDGYGKTVEEYLKEKGYTDDDSME